MGQHGIEPLLFDATQDAVQVHGRGEVRRLHQQLVAVVAQGQQVALFETFVEEGVHHILCCEVQLDGTLVGGTQLGETRPQPFGRIGDVLHNVGRTPHFREAQLLVVFQHLERGIHLLHAIVDSGQDVGVMVGETLQQSVDPWWKQWHNGPLIRLRDNSRRGRGRSSRICCCGSHSGNRSDTRNGNRSHSDRRCPWCH